MYYRPRVIDESTLKLKITVLFVFFLVKIEVREHILGNCLELHEILLNSTYYKTYIYLIHVWNM